MSEKISLKQILTRQWMLFTLALSLTFTVIMFFFLFALEDHFIEQKLERWADQIHTGIATVPASPNLQYFLLSAVPSHLVDIVNRLGNNEIAEFKTADERHVHLIKAQANFLSEPFVLVFDATDEIIVWDALGDIFILISPLILLLMLVAYGLAKSFTSKVTSHTGNLINQIRDNQSPQQLTTYAEREKVAEFAELGVLHAQAWQQKLDVIEREKQALEFLSHELRTPMQSAQASLELLLLHAPSDKVLQRLQRAISRLSRASTSILWLMDNSDTIDSPPVDITLIVDDFIAELSELTHLKKQTIQLDIQAKLFFNMPFEVAETILANILLNANQHGGAGDIVIKVTLRQITFSNHIDANNRTKGFGLGMVIVQRLSEKFGVICTSEINDDNGVMMQVSLTLAS